MISHQKKFLQIVLIQKKSQGKIFDHIDTK